MQDHPKIQQDDDGNLYLNFGSYGKEVEVACFSGDGTRVLTVEDVGVAKIWSTEGAQPQLVGEIRPTSPLDDSNESPTTQKFETYIEAAALNQNGSFALLGLNDGTAGVFDVTSGERLSTLHIADEHVYGWELIRSVAYSPDDCFVVVGFYDRRAGVWDRTGKTLIAKLIPEHSQDFFSDSTWGRNTLVSTVAVSPDNRYLFVGCGDLTCMIWDLENFKPVMSATEHVEKILATRMVGNVTTWVTTGGAIWRHSDGVVEKLLETKQHLSQAAISPDGQVMLTRSSDNQVRKTLTTGETELLAKLDVHPDSNYIDQEIIGFNSPALNEGIFYPDSKSTLVVGTERCSVDGWSARNICISSDNTLLAIIGNNWVGEIWHVGSNTQLLRTLPYLSAHAISSDTRLIAESVDPIGTNAPVINIMSVFPDEKRIEITQTLTTHKAEQLTFSPDGKYLYSAAFCGDGTIRRWQLQEDRVSFRKVAVLRLAGLAAIKLLDNGNLAALRTYDGVEVWTPDLSSQVSSHRFRLDYPAERTWSISDDQKYCVIGGIWSSLLKINLENGDAETITPPYMVPELVPDKSVTTQPPATAPNDSEVYKPDEGLQSTTGALLWRQPFGSFFHYTDGPRGWMKPLALSSDAKLALVPCQTEIGVVSLSNGRQEIKSRFPFEGTMRAGIIAGRVAMAVNAKGRLFTHELPDNAFAQ